ncbi:MAG: pyrroline-5-carboxylate reductase [Bacteroidales bacterium]
MEKIAIIGGGNLGSSLAEGFLRSGKVKAADMVVTRRRTHLLEKLEARNIPIGSNNADAVKQAEIIILCVKPMQAELVLEELSPVLDPSKHILVSAVTGLSSHDIRKWTREVPLFRVMPNTAVSINESMTCIAFRKESETHSEKVIALFSLLGRTMVINEELMEASTVLAACGIAYALRFLRAMTQGGIEIGFSSEMAQLIASQTLRGAAGLVLDTGNHPEKEIDKVTTPMGVTISGLNEMEHNGFSSALIKGIMISYKKIESPK